MHGKERIGVQLGISRMCCLCVECVYDELGVRLSGNGFWNIILNESIASLVERVNEDKREKQQFGINHYNQCYDRYI